MCKSHQFIFYLSSSDTSQSQSSQDSGDLLWRSPSHSWYQIFEKFLNDNFSLFRFWTVTNHWSISRRTPKFTEIGFNNSPLALIGTGDIPQLEIRSQTQLFLTTTHNLCTSSSEPGSIISDKRRTHWMLEMLNVIEYLYIWLVASGQECRVHSYIINWYHYQPSVTTFYDRLGLFGRKFHLFSAPTFDLTDVIPPFCHLVLFQYHFPWKRRGEVEGRIDRK